MGGVAAWTVGEAKTVTVAAAVGKVSTVAIGVAVAGTGLEIAAIVGVAAGGVTVGDALVWPQAIRIKLQIKSDPDKRERRKLFNLFSSY